MTLSERWQDHGSRPFAQRGQRLQPGSGNAESANRRDRIITIAGGRYRPIVGAKLCLGPCCRASRATAARSSAEERDRAETALNLSEATKRWRRIRADPHRESTYLGSRRAFSAKERHGRASSQLSGPMRTNTARFALLRRAIRINVRHAEKTGTDPAPIFWQGLQITLSLRYTRQRGIGKHQDHGNDKERNAGARLATVTLRCRATLGCSRPKSVPQLQGQSNRALSSSNLRTRRREL